MNFILLPSVIKESKEFTCKRLKRRAEQRYTKCRCKPSHGLNDVTLRAVGNRSGAEWRYVTSRDQESHGLNGVTLHARAN